MHRYLERFVVVVAVLVALAIGIGVYAWTGLYDIGADNHDFKPVDQFLTMARNHSIREHSKDIKVPNLDNRQLILKGAGQYAGMCTECHLAPGMTHSELRAGLYPQPPDLSKFTLPPQFEFWVIKHGIKMTAMPAWGYTHNDPTIWSIVAFLQKLPHMTPAQYKAIVAIAPPDEDMDMGGGQSHAHPHGGEPHAHSAMPGMAMPATTATAATPATSATVGR